MLLFAVVIRSWNWRSSVTTASGVMRSAMRVKPTMSANSGDVLPPYRAQGLVALGEHRGFEYKTVAFYWVKLNSAVAEACLLPAAEW
jgi:hypothetical protein